MSVRVSQRVGRQVITMGPLGWMVWSVVALPFYMMYGAVWLVVYTVRQIRTAVQDSRRRRAHRDALREDRG